MSDSDTPEPRPAPSTMGAFAQRLMARWHTTPVTATVQRAVSARPAAGIRQSASAQTLVQRITERNQPLTAWNAKATSTETAIESFTDKVVQRFPDYGVKYLPRTEETDSPPSKDVDMVFSGGRTTSGATEASTSQGQSSTFDPNSLPSVPPEVMARHRKNREEAAQTTQAKAAVQRKAAPPDPKLVRPRSRVDYFGSTTAPTPIAPVSTTSTTAETIQAKADDSAPAAPVTPEAVPDTPPIEQPTFRTRPRAGFQTIPTKNMSAPPGEGSKDVPFVPLQLKAEPEASAPASSADAPLSPTTDAPIQRVADDENGNDDEPPPSNDVPPDGPPPPPAPVSPNEPLQRVAAEPSDTQQPFDMPLRQHPDEPTEARPSDDTPVQRQIDDPRTTRAPVGTPIQRQRDASTGSVPVTLPPLSSAVPAKVVRRKMAAPAPEQVRRPTLTTNAARESIPSTPSAAPVQRQVADASSAPTTSTSGPVLNIPPIAASVSANSETLRDIPQRDDMPLMAASDSTDAPIQRMADNDTASSGELRVSSATAETPSTSVPTTPTGTNNTPLQRQAVEPSAPNSEVDSGVSSTSVASTNGSTPPLQRKATDTDAPALTDNPTVSASAQPITATPAPTRTDMPLREVDTGTAPIQRQADPFSVPEEVTGTTLPANAESPTATTPIQRQAGTTTINQGQEPNTTPRVESSVSASPIQRKSESAPDASVTQTENAPSPTNTPNAPIQRVVVGEGEPVANLPESPTRTSYVNEIRSEIETPPLQRQIDSTGNGERDAVSVEVPSASPTGLNRVDMPLRMAEDSSPVGTPDAPIQRQAIDDAASSATVADSASTSSAPIQRQASENATSVPTGANTVSTSGAPIQRQTAEVAPTPTGGASVAAAPSTQTTESVDLAPSAEVPIQRQIAERVSVAAPTSVTPSAVDMPLRALDSASDTTPIQRQVDESAVTSNVTSAETPTNGSVANAPIQRQIGAVDATLSVVQTPPQSVSQSTNTQTSAAPIQQQINDSAPTTNTVDSVVSDPPIQRVSAEPPTQDTETNRVEMPLRLNDTPSASTGQPPIQRQGDPTAAPTREAIANNGQTTAAAPTTIQRQTIPNQATPDSEVASTTASVNSLTPSAAQPTASASTPSQMATPGAPIQRVAAESGNEATVLANSDTPLRVAASPQTVASDAMEMPLRLSDTQTGNDTGTVQRAIDDTASEFPAQPVNLATVSDQTSASQNTNVVSGPVASSAPSVNLPLQRKVDNGAVADVTREVAQGVINRSTANEQPEMPLRTPAAPSPISESAAANNVTSSSPVNAPIQRVATPSQNDATAIQRVAAQTANDTAPVQVQATPSAAARLSRAEMPLRENDTTPLSNGTIQRQVGDAQATPQIATQPQETINTSTQAEAYAKSSHTNSVAASVSSPDTGTIQRVATTPSVANSQPSLDTPVRVTPSVVSSDAPEMPLRADAPLQRKVAEDGAAPATPIQRRAVDGTNESVAPRITVEPQSRAAETSSSVASVEMPLRALPTDAPVQRHIDGNTDTAPASPTTAGPNATDTIVSTATAPNTSTPSTSVATDALPIQRKSEPNIEHAPVQRRSEGEQTPAVKATPTVQTTSLPDMPLRTVPTADTAVVQRQASGETQEFFSADSTTTSTPPAPNMVQRTAATEIVSNDRPVPSTGVTPHVVQRVASPEAVSNNPTAAARVTPTHTETVQRVEMPLRAVGTELFATPSAPSLDANTATTFDQNASPVQRVADSTGTPAVTQGVSTPLSQTNGKTGTSVVQRVASTNGTTPHEQPMRVLAERTPSVADPALSLPLARSNDTSAFEPTIQRAVSTPAEYTESTPDVSIPVARVSPTIQRSESSPLPRTLRHLSQEGTAPTTLSGNWQALPIQRQTDSMPDTHAEMPLAAPATVLTSPSAPASDQIDMVIQRREIIETTSATTNSASNASVNDEPSESDTQRALETLARQIYPLLKQMLQRDRERHRGF